MVSPVGMPKISDYVDVQFSQVLTTQTITTFHASVSTDNIVTVQHGHGRFMTSDPTIWESTFHPPSFTDKERIYTSVQMQQQQQQGYAFGPAKKLS